LKVIILAAGRGSRLGTLTENTPKILVEISKGLTILEHQIVNIYKCGISDIVLVGGYKIDQIEEKIQKYSGTINIKLIYNPFYNITNNLVSLWMARDYMNDDFIIINGDNIFQFQLLKYLKEFKTDVGIGIKEKKIYDEDDMKVKITNNYITKINKQIDLQEVNGESIGIMKVSINAAKKFIDTLNVLMRDTNNLNAYYLEVFQYLASDGYPISPIICNQFAWSEIDFLKDLRHVKNNINSFLGE